MSDCMRQYAREKKRERERERERGRGEGSEDREKRICERCAHNEINKLSD